MTSPMLAAQDGQHSSLSRSDVQAILEQIESRKIGGRQQSTVDRIVQLRQLVEAGGVQTLEPMLPLCLTLQGKPYELSDHFPFSPIFKASMPSNLLLKTGRQVSKTLRTDSEFNRVYDEYGRRYRLRDISPGQKVQSFNTTSFRSCAQRVLFQHKNPVKTCYYIRTRRGVEMELAGTHPLYTYAGWTTVDDLDVGARIVHVRKGGRFGRKRVDERRLRVTAYMLGDGSFRGNYNFTANRHTQAIVEMRSLLRDYREYPKRETKGNSLVVNKDHVLYDWAKEDALHGKLSHEKQIPEWVFRLSKTDTRTFIERLWATDGMVKPGKLKATITYTSTSRDLVYDLKSLLSKFGIPTCVKERTGAYKKPDGRKVECRQYWVLRVETREGWKTFLDEFSVPDKPGFLLPSTIANNNRYTTPIEIAEIIAEIAGECRGVNRYGCNTETLLEHGLRKTPKYPVSADKLRDYLDFFRKHRPEHPRLEEFAKYVECDIDWDEIVEIRNTGQHECIDIEVEDTHNYLLDGVASHNSTSLASHGVMLANSVDFFRTLYVMPLYEQVRRFSNNYVRPFIDRSPIKPLWSGTTTENSVLQRSFKNLSMMLFSFALMDADRVRGISADKVAIDEVQDMDPDHIPIIREVMSHSPWSLMQFTGTPKSLDNPIEGIWKRSSQAEWIIPCYSCGEWSIPSSEFHIDKMMGPLHDQISERCPATICHKCQRPIFPRHGHWVHRYPQRRWKMAGYHVPQIIMPLHYSRHDKWSELLAKREGWGNTTRTMFYNEVLGESIDDGQKLLSETELRAAAKLPWRNNPDRPEPELMQRIMAYKTRILAVDWGGGGEDGVSFTTLAVLGFTPSGQVHVLWGKRLVASQEHLKEARECLHWLRAFRCHLMAHDYTGAGVVRETVMVQAGFDLARVMPIQYVRAASSNLMRYVEATVLHNRAHYRLDKTRSLLYVFQAVKLGLLQFFRYDYINDDNPGLLHDFLALVEEKTESRLAGDIYTITRNTMLTDDFAQAVNIGCAGLWHSEGAWPNFAEAAAIGKISSSQIIAAGSSDYGWDEDRASNFFGQP